MRGGRVLVLGDVMLDEFLWGKVARISPEAPVPVVEIDVARASTSAAPPTWPATCARWAARRCWPGSSGTDARGRARARRPWPRPESRTRWRRGRGRPTTVKTRIIAHHQQVVRADREARRRCRRALGATRCCSACAPPLPACGALIVSDYQKGVVTPRLMKAVLALARRRGVPVLVDPKVAPLRPLPRRRPGDAEPGARPSRRPGVRIRDRGGPARGRRDASCGGCGCDAALITRGEHGHDACSSRAAARSTSRPPPARSST